MDLSNNIYNKNRVSFIFSKEKERYLKQTEFFSYNLKEACYMVIGLIIMYLSIFVIISYIYKNTF